MVRVGPGFRTRRNETRHTSHATCRLLAARLSRAGIADCAHISQFGAARVGRLGDQTAANSESGGYLCAVAAAAMAHGMEA